MNEEILRKVEEAKKTGKLYLSSFGITTLNFLSGLSQLTKLDLRSNNIQDISPLFNLSQLTELDLGNNQIKDLSPLSSLSQLTNLSLNRNEIKDLSPLSNNKELKRLNLSFNQVQNLSPLSVLRQLNYFYLNGNQIQDLSPLSNLIQLKYLNLVSNQVQDLSPLSNLRQIKELNLSDNKIQNLSPFSGLSQLIVLNLANNQIKDLSPLSVLSKLTVLNLAKNQIENLSPLLGLIQLTVLNLANNQIEELSPISKLDQIRVLNLNNNKITNLKALLPLLKSNLKVEQYFSNKYETLQITNNPLSMPTLEIALKGSEAILDYFKELENAPSQESLMEAKVLLVGEGGVGKTSLSKKLKDKNNKLPEADDRTRGISITQISFPYKDKELNLNIWDFGGQDIYHATHRFFLTCRSLYILLTETRKKEHNFDYWIPNIRLFGKDSPILVVKNMFNGLQSHFSIRTYQKNEEFNIVGNIQDVNLKSGEGLNHLKTIIRHQAELLPLVGSLVPSTYVKVKKHLADIAKSKPYISFDRYLRICRKERIVDESSARTLAGYLHDLGLILWYAGIPGLKEKVIVQPEWATTAVYLIIDDVTISRKVGTFDKEDIERLWIDPSYRRLHEELLLLLEAFKLCYKKKTKEEWVIPSLLPLDPPDGLYWNRENDLTFQFSYTFMPKGMVNQLTAQLDKFIKDDDLVWGAGVVLADGNNEAYVQEDRLKRIVEIRVKGVNPSSFMGILINEMEDIHGTYPGIEVEKFVPCECGKCKGKSEPQMIRYEELIKRLKKGKSNWFCNEGDEFVDILQMVNNVGISGRALDVNDGMEFGSIKVPTRRSFKSQNQVLHSEIHLKVAKYLTQGDTLKAFEYAISSTFGTDIELFNFILVQKAAFVNLEKKRLKGTIGDEAYGIELNKIHDGLLGALG